jgi:methionyl aminopeptidase
MKLDYPMNAYGVTLHDDIAFDGMRKAGYLAASVLDALVPYVRAGITTNQINDFCHNMIIAAGAIPAPLNYKGFPKSVCTSLNHVVCHGIPDDRVLKEGDILNIDVTVIVDGWYGDTSRMFWVGEVSTRAKVLTDITYDGMMAGIATVAPNSRLGDIGEAIENLAKNYRFGVVTEYCGHGLGRVFHTAPSVLHYGKKGTGMALEQGMFFTVEPMLNAGKPETKLNKEDGWTVTTRDRSLSCQFEHSVGVTATGVEIFTTSPQGLHKPPFR